LKNVHLVPKLVQISTMIDDIPEAVRQVSPRKQQGTRWNLWLRGGMGLVGLISGALFLIPFLTTVVSGDANDPGALTVPDSEVAVTPPPADLLGENLLLGHLPSAEAPMNTLVPVGSDGSTVLRKAAAAAFSDMAAAAREEGVNLVPLSGFRSMQTQNSLFFDIKAQRGQDAVERATVSAPPGYSEHHTGYALDIGTGDVPATHVNPKFGQTEAFRWLENHAAHFHFELSFPPDNPQGVDYEPWHWRFVGDRQSLETFYKARQLPAPGSKLSQFSYSSEVAQ